jgi:hypothetical protein
VEGRHGHSTGKSVLEEFDGIIVTFLGACSLCAAHPSSVKNHDFSVCKLFGIRVFLLVSDGVQWRLHERLHHCRLRISDAFGTQTIHSVIAIYRAMHLLMN